MSVLIKGMEMPTSCTVCPFENYGDCYGGKVKAIMDIDDYVSDGKRHPRCPLVPVPNHGRLIDGDKLDAYLKTAAIMADGEAKEAYIDARAEARTMPIIIPAEEGE